MVVDGLRYASLERTLLDVVLELTEVTTHGY